MAQRKYRPWAASSVSLEMVWKANSLEANEIKYFIKSQSFYKEISTAKQ